MNGKGRVLDNIFVERLLRSLNFECVYLHTSDTRPEARVGVRKWVKFYNHTRRIPPLAANHPLWFTGREIKQLNQISRCKE
tara:strand:- start:4440 stop:4682 length:243 start_codon:yes stop_codon:yes gene_type:complete